MTWTLARSIRAAFDEANRLYPARSKASDGTIGDQAHASRTSDHNPCADHRIVHAGDFTHDPRAGFDAHAWVRRLAAHGDQRVKYYISAGKIWNPASEAWGTYRRLRAEGHSRRDAARMAFPGERTYTGANPHDRHAHLSIKHTDAARNDTSSWFYDDAATSTTPQEATVAFALDGTAAVQPIRRDQQGRVAFWGWRKDGSVFAFNGAPGPIPSTAAKGHIGSVTALLPDNEGGYFLVGGEPGVGATWSTYRSSEFPAEWRA